MSLSGGLESYKSFWHLGKIKNKKICTGFGWKWVFWPVLDQQIETEIQILIAQVQISKQIICLCVCVCVVYSEWYTK